MRLLFAVSVAALTSACSHGTATFNRNDVSLVRTTPPMPRVVEHITIVKFPNSYRVDAAFPAGTPWYAPNLAEGSSGDN